MVPNEVWSVDFKGWFRTADGTRVEPLTVRDMASRFILATTLLRTQNMLLCRDAFTRVFREYGLPKAIRMDNGTPFGGTGALGLTRLSAWWVKLGIVVEFITPGRPCENGSHEQFHRVYKAEVAARPARTVLAQQERSTLWLWAYNHQRPHEALGMRRPVELFEKNPRRLPKRIKAWEYPAGWQRRWVKGNGEISWQGVRRFVGEAFLREYVGLKPKRRAVWQVYFGPMLVGELHEKERGRLRLAKYRRAR